MFLLLVFDICFKLCLITFIPGHYELAVLLEVVALQRGVVATIAYSTVSAIIHKCLVQFAVTCRKRKSNGVYNFSQCMFA